MVSEGRRAQPQCSPYELRLGVGRGGGTELRAEGALWHDALALALSLRVQGPKATFSETLCTSRHVCEQASICSSVKWDSILCLPEQQAVAGARGFQDESDWYVCRLVPIKPVLF